MQEYDDLVREMAIAEHMTERLIGMDQEENALRYLVEEYTTFLRGAKQIQRQTGELNHYRMIKATVQQQMTRFAEMIGFPIAQVEAIDL